MAIALGMVEVFLATVEVCNFVVEVFLATVEDTQIRRNPVLQEKPGFLYSNPI